MINIHFIYDVKHMAHKKHALRLTGNSHKFRQIVYIQVLFLYMKLGYSYFPLN